MYEYSGERDLVDASERLDTAAETVGRMSASPLRPTAILTSLPIELLTQISLHSDRRTALSLARVCRKFTFAAEHRIYRDLDLLLPASYGEYPLVQPHKRSGHGAHVTWAKAEARRAEDRHREGLREKVKGIMVNAGARRLGMVEKVTMVQRPGAINAVLALLDVLSPNLRELEMRAAADHVFAQDWRATEYETFDVKVIDYSLSLPALTHIHINNDTVRFAETVIILCRAAPNLVSLVADLHGNTAHPTWYEDMVPMPPATCFSLGMPKLRFLRLAFSDRDDEAEETDFHPLVGIIDCSPRLEQVHLRYTSEDGEITGHLLAVLSKLELLQDLYINLDPETFWNHVDEDTPGFPALERLVLRSGKSYDFFSWLQPLPKLKSVHVERPHIGKILVPPGPTGYPEPSPCLSMLPHFAEALRNSPHLAIIHSLRSISAKETKLRLDTFPMLDKIEQMDGINGTVRSFIHDGEELLHARFFLDITEISDEPVSDNQGQTPLGSVEITYSAGDVDRKRVFQQRSEGQWQDFTDWDGIKVPLEILQQMRLAQGSKLETWQGRGVDVGDKAWKVLTDWRAKVEQENRDDGLQAVMNQVFSGDNDDAMIAVLSQVLG